VDTRLHDQAARGRLEEALQATLGWHARFVWQTHGYMVTMWRSAGPAVFAATRSKPAPAGLLRFAVAEHDGPWRGR